jgi:hypothetical protein
LLPTNLLAINHVADVAGFLDLHINIAEIRHYQWPAGAQRFASIFSGGLLP